MFLTKKAEEDFINFVKQAKEVLASSSDINQFAQITELIKNNEINKAVEAVQKLNKVTEVVPFYKSREFTALSGEQQQQFRDSVDLANGVKQATEDVDGKLAEAKEADKSEDLESVSLSDVPGKDSAEVTVKEKETVSEKDADPLDELAELAGSDDFKEEATMFEYLSKKAEEVPTMEAAIQTKPAEDKILQVINAAVEYGEDNGLADEDIIAMAASDAGVDGNNEEVRVVIKDQLAKYKNKIAPHTIEEKTVRTASLIAGITNYQEEQDRNDIICDLAKTSANSTEFLEKCAVALDESSKSKQYAGKKMFDGEHTTFSGGQTPKFPGQKVFMERAGGNPAVETIFPTSAKPEVDVYKDKSGRKEVTTIKNKDSIIAYIQPVAPAKQERLDIPFDYTGIVGGDIQRTKADAGEPKAKAAHITNNYLDSINELADKTPEKLAGKLPKASASKTAELTVDAGFVFSADLKKKADYIIDIGTSSAIPNDASIAATPVGTGPEKRMLTEEELSEARKKYQERENAIQRASGFCFSIKAEDLSLYDTAVGLLEALKSFPAAYTAVKQAAETEDLTTFATVLKKAIITNLRDGDPELDTLVEELPFNKIRTEYFSLVQEAPVEKSEPAGKEPADKENEEDTSDGAAELDALLSGEE